MPDGHKNAEQDYCDYDDNEQGPGTPSPLGDDQGSAGFEAGPIFRVHRAAALGTARFDLALEVVAALLAAEAVALDDDGPVTEDEAKDPDQREKQHGQGDGQTSRLGQLDRGHGRDHEHDDADEPAFDVDGQQRAAAIADPLRSQGAQGVGPSKGQFADWALRRHRLLQPYFLLPVRVLTASFAPADDCGATSAAQSIRQQAKNQ
jgi:hypothetical protein